MCGADETVRICDLSGAPIGPTLERHIAPVRAFASYEVQGCRLLATGGEDGTVRIWNEGGDEIECIRRAGWVRGIAVASRKGKPVLGVVGQGSAVLLLDAADGSDVDTLEAHQNWVMAICAFQEPDGQTRLATGGDDETVRIWDPDNPDAPRHTLLGHTGPVRAVVPIETPAGLRLASGSDDKTVRIWSLDGERVACIRLGCVVNALAPIGGGVVAGTAEGHLVIDVE
jgi:WD40 repeat protein